MNGLLKGSKGFMGRFARGWRVKLLWIALVALLPTSTPEAQEPLIAEEVVAKEQQLEEPAQTEPPAGEVSPGEQSAGANPEEEPEPRPAGFDDIPLNGIHHRRIITGSDTNLDGTVTTRGYVHLELGLNYLDEAGELRPSDPLIEAFPDGAIARQSATKVIFSPDLDAAGAVDLITPGQVRLRGTPIGLAYFDAASGQSILLAETHSSKGKIVAPTKIVYENFLDDVKADAVYEISKSGLMQTIVIKEDIAPPSAYGLPDATTRLEVLTEFIDPPKPAKRPRVLKREEDEAKRHRCYESTTRPRQRHQKFPCVHPRSSRVSVRVASRG